MKRTITTLLASALVCSPCLLAQSLQTNYFLDNNPYSFRISPSLPAEKGFMSLALGDINLGLQTDMGINTFIFPEGDRLVTGFNKAISTERFIGGMKNANSLGLGVNESVFSVGSWGKKSFSTFEVNVRVDGSASLPQDMFALLKSGAPRTYDLKYLHANVQGWIEAAYGMSVPINDYITVGARAKLLMGVAGATLNLNKADLTITGEEISTAVDGEIMIASEMLTAGTKASTTSGANDVLDLTSIQFTASNIAPAGYGAAFDFGVTYMPIDDLFVTFSMNDVGRIGWKCNLYGRSSAEASLHGIRDDVYIKDTFNAMVEEITDAATKLTNLAEFHTGGQLPVKHGEWLPWSMNLGARYYMPFYNRLSAGVLYTHKHNTFVGYNDFRVGATVTPVDWFSITGNFGGSSFGPVCGMSMSLSAVGIDFMAGFDGFAGAVMPISIGDTNFSLKAPLNPFRVNLKLGLAITFGPRHAMYKSVAKAE